MADAQGGARPCRERYRRAHARFDFLIGGSVNAAMANFSKGLAQLGKRDGVNVNVVHPGTTDTERTHNLLAQSAAASGRPVEELQREMLAGHGLRRLGHPDDIAAAAMFLCAERARHIQGRLY
jgi:3-oxoacyl-[acyl-carrier protein] reductase